MQHKKDLVQHKVNSVLKKAETLKCSICNKTFASYHHLWNHINVQTNILGLRENLTSICANVQSFECAVCTKKFKDRRHLWRHLKSVHTIAGFKCNHCDKRFGLKICLYKLYHHIKAAHKNVQDLECAVCTKKFEERRHLLRHLKSVSANFQGFECAVCTKKFEDHCHLWQHIKSAHTIAGFKCNYCDKRFGLNFCLYKLYHHIKAAHKNVRNL
jgi:uncharacterized Zn-finger protein